MTTCLFVRPAFSADANGGDSVVYRRVETYLGGRSDLAVLELTPLSRLGQLLNVARGLPPEAARYEGAANRARLIRALAERPFDAVVFGHEAVFPLSTAIGTGGPRKIFYSHNVQSVFGLTDRSLTGRLTRPAALAFDRRWYADPTAAVVCISESDLAGLRRIGVGRADIAVAPPGAPPAVDLADDAVVLSEVVLTGSYGWWRKRRDLEWFAAQPPLPYPILAGDSAARAILGRQAEAGDMTAVDWSRGLRFALVTDRFAGGFKLKSLEYVALNGLVLSFCDLAPEFAGLPHADEFVRFVRSKAEVQAAIELVSAMPQAALLARFRTFKSACMARYQWDRTLAPLGALIT